jgi:hypothetical protein
MLIRWITRTASAAGLLLCLGIVLSATATRYDFVGKLTGFHALMVLAQVARVVAAVGLIGFSIVLWTRRTLPAGAPPFIATLLALFVGGGYFLWTEQWIAAVDEFPLLHDVSTDLTDPPQFSTLGLSPDNLRGVNSVEVWAKRHQEGYPDLKPVRSPIPAAQLWINANAIVQSRGWKIARSDASAGQIEAIDTTSVLRFRDMVSIRVRSDGAGSVLDIRSVSEVGTSDLGVNAKRIRAFISELKK